MSSLPDRERWRRVERILDEALDRPPADREAFLREACPDRATLREVRELIEACEKGDGFLDEGALAWTAGMLFGIDPGGGRVDDPDGAAPGGGPDDGGRGFGVAGDSPDGPARLGRYEVLSELGRGGMGVVYLAHDPRLRRRVAVKLLPPHLSADPSAAGRLEREARAASAIQHPNVVAVYDVGEAPDGRPYIVMAHHPGSTLRDLLADGPLPRARALAIGRQVAAGLAAAHAEGVVHRDVKPANVLIDRGGTARVVDFGIAYARDGGEDRALLSMGTAAYMSPEHARGEVPDPRSDVWALGVLLCEMATGARPFRGDAVDTVLAAVAGHEPALPETLRGPLRDIVAGCLRKDPAERPADAGEVAALLEALPGARPPGRSWWRHPGRLAAAVGFVALLVAGALALLGSEERAVRDAPLGGTAVVPLVPLAPDSALERLGRELAVTLAASLSSVSEVPLIDPWAVLGRIPPGADPAGDGLAASLGADRVLRGSLIRVGTDSVRAEVTLAGAGAAGPIARASASAPVGDIGGLTDSLTLGILRRTWTRGEVPAPSLAGLTTSSVPALGAYLKGERAMAGGDFVAAVAAFERAFALDSTFRFAYWRSLYPRSHEGTDPADSAVVADLWEHRHELPRPDRLLFEARRQESLTRSLEMARTLTEEHPTYWPGWWEYANLLIHDGPYLGTTQAQARAALDRVLHLQPGFAPAWQHRLWLDLYARDTAAIARGLGRLRTLAAPDGQFYAQEELRYYEALEDFIRAGGGSRGVGEREAETLLRGLPPVSPAALGHGMLEYSLPAAQIDLGTALLAGNPPKEIAVAMRVGMAKSWAARGDWGAALTELEEADEVASPEELGVAALQLAVAGGLLGGVEPARILEVRERVRPVSAADSAEVDWLDGVAAYARGDEAALARAIRALDVAAYPHAALLRESLSGFRRALADPAHGAEAIAALEEQKADAFGYASYAPAHPYMSAIHRIWAGRQLLRDGQAERARRLLGWHQAVRWGRTNPEEWANRTLEPLALLERAEIAAGQGRPAEARSLYAEFLSRYDRPEVAGVPLVERARAGLRALGEAADDGA